MQKNGLFQSGQVGKGGYSSWTGGFEVALVFGVKSFVKCLLSIQAGPTHQKLKRVFRQKPDLFKELQKVELRIVFDHFVFCEPQHNVLMGLHGLASIQAAALNHQKRADPIAFFNRFYDFDVDVRHIAAYDPNPFTDFAGFDPAVRQQSVCITC